MNFYVPPPESLLMQIANDPSEANFRASFEGVRDSVLNYCDMANLKFKTFESILDFGCGVGHFIFAMHEDGNRNQKFYGCDINYDCARWCRENISFTEIDKAPLVPPFNYQSN